MTKLKEPVICQKQAYIVEVEEGKRYSWCSCGLSSTQPFCDGTHKDTGYKSLKYTAEQSKKIAFCGCKHTKNPPFCDGTHSSL